MFVDDDQLSAMPSSSPSICLVLTKYVAVGTEPYRMQLNTRRYFNRIEDLVMDSI